MPPAPGLCKSKRDFILNAVAIGILIPESDQNIFKLLRSLRHFLPYLFQPVRIDPELGIDDILSGFIAYRKAVDLSVRCDQTRRIIIPAVKKCGDRRGIVFQIFIQRCQLFVIPRYIHISQNRIRKAVRAEHDIDFFLPAGLGGFPPIRYVRS